MYIQYVEKNLFHFVTLLSVYANMKHCARKTAKAQVDMLDGSKEEVIKVLGVAQ